MARRVRVKKTLTKQEMQWAGENKKHCAFCLSKNSVKNIAGRMAFALNSARECKICGTIFYVEHIIDTKRIGNKIERNRRYKVYIEKKYHLSPMELLSIESEGIPDWYDAEVKEEKPEIQRIEVSYDLEIRKYGQRDVFEVETWSEDNIYDLRDEIESALADKLGELYGSKFASIHVHLGSVKSVNHGKKKKN